MSISGQYLVDKILEQPQLELAFVWNRTASTLHGKVADELILHDLEKFSEK